MYDRLIPPMLAKQLVNDDDAMCGTGKIVTCNHPNHSLFGGIVREPMGDPKNQNWLMTVGTVIVVPCKHFVWADNSGMCGWSIEDILTQGMDQERYWVPAE